MNRADDSDQDFAATIATDVHNAGAPLAGTLPIATLPIGAAALIGLVPCPGRNHIDASGRCWRRELEADLDALQVWGAEAIISLVEAHEFALLGVADFGTAVARRALHWHHLPIRDMSVPDSVFQEAWKTHGVDIFGSLHHGRRIIIHCAGGLGRSGMIAAKLLTAFDVTPDEAVRRVRAARPGAIETREQEDFVVNGPALAADAA